MGISPASLNQQLIDMQSDEAAFKKDMDSKQRVKDEENQLKKTLTDVAIAMKGGGKKAKASGEKTPESAQTAYILAIAQMMQGNLEVMGNSADHMTALQPQIESVNDQLNSVYQQLGNFTQQSSPSDLLVNSQGVNTELNALNTHVGVLGMSDGQDSTYISYLASQNNAEAGLSQAMINTIVDKEGHYKG